MVPFHQTFYESQTLRATQSTYNVARSSRPILTLHAFRQSYPSSSSRSSLSPATLSLTSSQVRTPLEKSQRGWVENGSPSKMIRLTSQPLHSSHRKGRRRLCARSLLGTPQKRCGEYSSPSLSSNEDVTSRDLSPQCILRIRVEKDPSMLPRFA